MIISLHLFQELLKTMKKNFDNSLCDLASEEEKEIILEHARFGRLVTKIFLFCVYYFEIIMFLVPIIIGRDSDPARKKRYPFCAWFYWDQDSDFFYGIAYIVQVRTKTFFLFETVSGLKYKFQKFHA